MNIIAKVWFSGQSCIGVVLVEDQYEGLKAYIGNGMGIDEDRDADHIASWGSTFPLDAAKALFGEAVFKNRPSFNYDNTGAGIGTKVTRLRDGQVVGWICRSLNNKFMVVTGDNIDPSVEAPEFNYFDGAKVWVENNLS